MIRPTRRSLAVSACATVCGLLVAAFGLLLAREDGSAGARFWAVAFFICLLWPVGLTLVAQLAGHKGQISVACVLLVGTTGQHMRPTAMPLPENVRWVAPLTEAGDAIRYQLPLPAPDAVPWVRAWNRASRAAVVVCTEPAVPPASVTTISVNGATAVPLHTLHRNAAPHRVGWYELPVARSDIERATELEVVLRRESPEGPPVGLCGGRTDPSRAGRSSRWLDGRWVTSNLPFWYDPPAIRHPERYHVELRFFDARGAPTIAVWY